MPNYKGVWVLNQVLEAIGQDNWPRNPSAPTIGTATAGDSSATVEFTAPTDEGTGTIASYRAVSTPGSIEGTASSSPVTVSGLTNGTSYTFAVQAVSNVGTGPFSAQSNSVTPAAPAADMLVGGGGTSDSATYNSIVYINISTSGNSTTFGDLSYSSTYGLAACSSSTRGIFAGGASGIVNYANTINYLTIGTTGSVSDFGDLSLGKRAISGSSNSTRGLFFGGFYYPPVTTINTIEYITIASTGNASDFGDMTQVSSWNGALASPTRAVCALGNVGGTTKQMQYVSIASTGNSVVFGNLTVARDALCGLSSSTRGVFCGGENYNIIDYITIATTGAAIDFGDLTQVVGYAAASSSETVGIVAGGYSSGATTINVIQSITIASAGNATDFGDLNQIRQGCAGLSNAHGGLS